MEIYTNADTNQSVQWQRADCHFEMRPRLEGGTAFAVSSYIVTFDLYVALQNTNGPAVVCERCLISMAQLKVRLRHILEAEDLHITGWWCERRYSWQYLESLEFLCTIFLLICSKIRGRCMTFFRFMALDQSMTFQELMHLKRRRYNTISESFPFDYYHSITLTGNGISC